VSVDTNFKRKNLSRYSVMQQDDVKVLLSFTLWRWAKEVHVGAKQGWIGRTFDIEVAHRHTSGCSH
jgi:hypothetical protein